MQIQQLKYLIAAAEQGSFRSAAQKLYISQSSISVAVKDLEQELGITVFNRTSRGISLTPEGAELVERVRNVVEQIELIEQGGGRAERPAPARLAVSSQHYSLVVDAFGDFAAAHEEPLAEFVLRESYTNEIIRDVQEGRSDLGIIYLSNYNDRVMRRALAAAGVAFTPLYAVTPHIVVHERLPLATQDEVTLEELEGYYRFEHEQGLESSSYFAEEPLASIPHDRRIVVSDNGTLATLLERVDGYALGTGAFLKGGSPVVAVPISCDEVMNVGFIRTAGGTLSTLAEEFLALLCERIVSFEGELELAPFTRAHAQLAGDPAGDTGPDGP